MPYPLNPPPQSDTGALTYPRTLQRWLDDNPVSKLTRVSTFINLPVFQQTDSSWNGYTDIVYAYNFEGPNNFSLKPFKAPSNPNYSLCVSWNFAATGQVVRYVLWLGVGATSPLQAPMYSGQPILKNFRLEIWNTGFNNGSTPVSNANQIIFYTSKLGGQDYRWAVDYTLVASDPQVNNFNITNPQVIVNHPDDRYEYYKGDDGITLGGPLLITQWQGDELSIDLNQVDLSLMPAPQPSIMSPAVNCVSFNAGHFLQGQFISNKIAILFSANFASLPNTTTNFISTGIGGINVYFNLVNGQYVFNVYSINGSFALVNNYPYILIVDSGNGESWLYDAITGAQVDYIKSLTTVPYNSGSTTILGTGNSTPPVNPDSLVSDGVPLDSGGQPILK